MVSFSSTVALPLVLLDVTMGMVGAVTVTMKDCMAVSPSMSVAVTVMVAVPAPTPVTVTMPMSSTMAVATISSLDITVQVSMSSASASVMLLWAIAIPPAEIDMSAMAAPAMGAVLGIGHGSLGERMSWIARPASVLQSPALSPCACSSCGALANAMANAITPMAATAITSATGRKRFLVLLLI